MPRKKTIQALSPVARTGLRYIGGQEIRFDQIYHVPALQPKDENGPWSREADKLAWIDAATGYACIILREGGQGHLCGYVGVEPSHQLFGFSHDAFPHSARIRAHGGLNYSELCDETRLEAMRVCHIRKHSGERHDPRWWFGFSCDQPYDLVPGRERMAEPDLSPDLAYRDEAYLFNQCTGLAAQLAAFAEGRSPDTVPIVEPPAVGSDRLRARE